LPLDNKSIMQGLLTIYNNLKIIFPRIDLKDTTYRTGQYQQNCQSIEIKFENKDNLLLKYNYLFPPVYSLGIFALQSKINHSCEPNVVYNFKENNIITVEALANITVNEELCATYIDVDQPYTDRQFDLRKFGFTCTCPKCQKESTTTN